MKLKHKTKRKPIGFSLDFVTPLTPDECRMRLNESAAQQRQPTRHIGFYTTGDFSFDGFGGYYSICFEGTLQTVTQGTWVRGRINEHTVRRIRLEQRLVKAGLAAYTLFLAYSLASSGGQIPADQAADAIGLAVFLGPMLWLLSRRSQLITVYAQQMVSWLHEALFVPPDPFEKTVISPINLDGLYSVERRTSILDDLLENPSFARLLKMAFWLVVILFAVAGTQ